MSVCKSLFCWLLFSETEKNIQHGEMEDIFFITYLNAYLQKSVEQFSSCFTDTMYPYILYT